MTNQAQQLQPVFKDLEPTQHDHSSSAFLLRLSGEAGLVSGVWVY